MHRFLLILSLLLFLGLEALFAQTKVITGKVIGDDGEPIPGASVVIKGTNTGVVTDLDGVYNLQVPADATAIQISFLGMKTQELAIGDKTNLNATLESDAVNIDEVVVTAMGMKRSEKTLGYGASTLKSDELTVTQNSNLMSSMAGKVAGVQVSNSGQAGSSTKVIIRGFTSLQGSNQPLYVIDGVPISNDFSGNDDFSRSVDYGNGANDINPEDIESTTILKGASATALYGSRAASGVIMITTKKAKLNEGLKVIYNGSYGVSDILRIPQTQNMFGQGWGFFDPAENGSWGPKYDGVNRPWGVSVDANGLGIADGYDYGLGDYDLTKGTPRYSPYSYVEDNARNFYEKGFETTHNISISGGTELSTFNMSYAYTGADGVIPTNADEFNRNLFSFRGETKYKKFSAEYSVNYVNKIQNAVSAGQGQSDGGATLYQEMLQTPGSIDLQQLSDYKSQYNNSDNFYTWYASNPYFIINENGNESRENRVYGKIQLNYEIIKGLKAMARLGSDIGNTRIREWGAIEKFAPTSWSAAGGKAETVGRYEEIANYNNQLDATGSLNFNYDFATDFNVSGQVGMTWNQITNNTLDSYVSGLKVPKWYSLENSSDRPLSTSNESRKRVYAAFGEATLGFRNYAFISGSLRNDHSSTLPEANNSYLYGGINTSILLTEMFKDIQGNVLNFWKVRLAVGQTGKDAPLYRTSTPYYPTQIGLGYGNLYLPLQGVGGLTKGNTLANTNIKPEITTELEIGTQAAFWNNRIIIDFALYDKRTKNQIISANAAPETGYSRQTLNVGEIQNKGVEISLEIVPVKINNFEWNLATNFTKNNSKVLKLWDGNNKYLLNSSYDVDWYAEVGKPLGQFYAPKAEVAPAKINGVANPYAGYTVVNSTGRPKIDPNEKQNMGSSQSDFTMGFVNKFTYKKLTFTASVDWRQGGKFYSYTQQLLSFTGNTFESTFNERQPFVTPHTVKEVLSSTGDVIGYEENNINTTLTSNYAYWYSNTNNVMYQHTILDRTNVKLRELALAYSLPKLWASKIGASALDMSVYGRNLLLWTPAENNFVDPEATNYGNDLNSEFGEFAAGPSSRTYGASLRVTF